MKSSLHNQNLDGEFSDQWCLFLTNTLWTLFNCSKFFFFYFFSLIWFFFPFFFQDGGCTCPGDVSKAFGKCVFNIILRKIIWSMLLTPHSFPNKKINNLFWSKFLFSYTYYMEPACFITLFHLWPQVLVQILSWWEACLLAMISLVSKAWSLLSFANDSLKYTATFSTTISLIDLWMSIIFLH